jgi:hypothetical protein
MHRHQHGVRIFRSLTRRTGACIALRVARQPLELVVASRIAEYDLVSGSRENRSQLAAINPDPRMPTRIPLYLSFRYLLLVSDPLISAVLRGTEHLAR